MTNPLEYLSAVRLINETVLGDGVNNPGRLTLKVAPGKGDTFIKAGNITDGDFDNSDTNSGFIFGIDDSDSDLAKFYVGDDTFFIKWDGSALSIEGSYLTYSAGDLLLQSSDAEVSTTSESVYVKLKEIGIGQGGGTLRIKFDMKNNNAGSTVNGRVYRNGVAVGTEQSTTLATYTTYSEDISGWGAGDLIQIYAQTQVGGVGSFIQNFRVYADKSLLPYVIT